MWLLNTSTRELHPFTDERGVSYAILSHRWTAEELLFQDIFKADETSLRKSGWDKLTQTCVQARLKGYEWVWIDTCCIDKSSSAELSEAINSMYRWYQNAAVCLVFLNDVIVESDDDGMAGLSKSIWFTRGWTLQELLAPHRIEFYDSEWNLLGTREKLHSVLSLVTGIPGTLLTGVANLKDYSIAQRMSWAANRRTTRIEDVAYSLMGLFSVNMPLLYGEGDAAFKRLQEEIMKDSADETIFAWKFQNNGTYHSLLAQSPDDFADCGQMIRPAEPIHREFFLKTNRGLRITLFVRHHITDVYHAALDCVEIDANGMAKRTGIFLGCPVMSVDTVSCARRTVSGQGRLTFKTETYTEDPDICGQAFLLSFTIPSRPFPGIEVRDIHNGFVIREFAPAKDLDIGHGVLPIVRKGTWDPVLKTVTLLPGTNGASMCFAVLEDSSPIPLVVGKLGFSQKFTPLIILEPLEELSERSLLREYESIAISEGTVRSPGSLGESTVDSILMERLNPRLSKLMCFEAHHRDGLAIQTEFFTLQCEIDYHARFGLAWHLQLQVVN